MKITTTPGGRNWFGTRSLFVRKSYYPYGQWTCADGREVLFNRFYEPIWQRYNGAPAERADPTEWVKFIKQSFFYNDGNIEGDLRRNAAEVLTLWGVQLPEQPGALLPRHVAVRHRTVVVDGVPRRMRRRPPEYHGRDR